MKRLRELQKAVSIKNWIHYNPDVGVLALHQWGQPGSGKSNASTGLAAQCVSKKNEFLVMPGDRWCEWKHFINHDLLRNVDLTVIIPNDASIYYYGIKEDSDFFEYCNYSKLKVMDYLNETNRILVIYDAHITPNERTSFWVYILKQLLNQTDFINRAIILLYHEASVLFPERSKGDKWHDIRKYAELFVEARKALVRHIFITQLETELESTLRGKCGYQMLRKGRAARHHHPEIIKSTPFLRINEYNLVMGSGGWKKYNKIKKFYENKKILKMIPQDATYVKGGIEPLPLKEKKTLECQNCGYVWNKRVDYPRFCQKCSTEFNIQLVRS